jgi:hypothetical protein
VNRQQRRANRRQLEQLAEVEQLRVSKRNELEAQSIEICAWIRASDEPVAERLEQVAQTITELEGQPQTVLVAGPALVHLRALRDELAQRQALS